MKVLSSAVILEMQAAWNLPSTTVSVVTTMLIKLCSYVTWSTSGMVAFVQLPLNSVFFYIAELLIIRHVVL